MSKKNRPAQRIRLHQKASGLCHYCGRYTYLPGDMDGTVKGLGLMATIDHVKPTALGGKDKSANRVLPCEGCNGEKGSRPLTEPEGGHTFQVDLTKMPGYQKLWPAR